VLQVGYVLGPKRRSLASELAECYLRGDLVVVAGAGVSRASGLPVTASWHRRSAPLPRVLTRVVERQAEVLTCAVS
jgi:hypothetical protein